MLFRSNFKKIEKIIKKTKSPRVVFLFKVIDSLELFEKNSSKKLLKSIVPLADEVVVSFAIKSLSSHKKFKVKRNWLVNFIKDNFKILKSFELGNEKYFVLSMR